MAGKAARPMMDPEAAEELRQTVRDMSAQERRPVTIGEAVRRLVASWRIGQPDGQAADNGRRAIST